MEPAEYEVMFRNEDGHWWYWGLRDLLLPLDRWSAGGQGPVTVLDAGSGTGRNLAELAGPRAFGVELAPEAFAFLKCRGLDNVARASVCRLPFADATFDAVVSTDVICCLEPPGDRAAVRELARVLRPGGRLLLNLPAYEALRSRHDAAVHTRQRFTRSGLVRLLEGAGLRVERATYRNTLLFPIAAAARLAQRATRGDPGPRARSEVAPVPRPLNALLKAPLALENRWIRGGGRLPFGLSIFCVATRP